MTKSDVVGELGKSWGKCWGTQQKKILREKKKMQIMNKPFSSTVRTDFSGLRAAALWLKPLRLPRARSLGTGEGGDWWS